jgi:hypothetical protein
MVKQEIRVRSSKPNPAIHDDDSRRRFGVNWPFPLQAPTPWTAKQEKSYQANQLAQAEEAPF